MKESWKEMLADKGLTYEEAVALPEKMDRAPSAKPETDEFEDEFSKAAFGADKVVVTVTEGLGDDADEAARFGLGEDDDDEDGDDDEDEEDDEEEDGDAKPSSTAKVRTGPAGPAQTKPAKKKRKLSSGTSKSRRSGGKKGRGGGGVGGGSGRRGGKGGGDGGGKGRHGRITLGKRAKKRRAHGA